MNDSSEKRQTTRIMVKPSDANASEFELDAVLFREKVCVSFKTDGNTVHRQLAQDLKKMLHDDADPSIADQGGTCTLSTIFSSVPEMMEFLRKFRLRCRESGLPPLGPRTRIVINLPPEDPPAAS